MTTVRAEPVEAIRWQWLPFDALSRDQLYELLRLRSEVFVVEQNCVFQDMDGLDGQAMHLLGTRVVNGVPQLVAYVRCFPPGIAFDEASIGRVVTRQSARGGGLGHVLMAEAIRTLQQQWGAQPIRIGAQAHLKDFYQRHGFADVDKPYVEDGIDHIEMLRAPS
ncbi:GNAT family N-acetyltransferase [Rhodoferax saidenbachensis]|uniref:GNAT family N-acetyltransferase n=2 Tax=Rhodoferax saidenbachensis TaxID=1484693 RepID=A0A1P8KFG6_9BURK|nr:GNAT family N-acetyltransferase [Rhodoferax saidenbachensis]